MVIYLDGGGETAFKTRRLTTFTNTHVNSPFINPTFQIGRIIQGGDGRLNLDGCTTMML
jgi:hypothetical protein